MIRYCCAAPNNKFELSNMFCTVHELVGKENGRSVYTNRRLALFSKVKGVGGSLIFLAFNVECPGHAGAPEGFDVTTNKSRYDRNLCYLICSVDACDLTLL